MKNPPVAQAVVPAAGFQVCQPGLQGLLRRVRPSWVLFVMAWLVGMLQMIHPVGWGFGRGFEMSSIARYAITGMR